MPEHWKNVWLIKEDDDDENKGKYNVNIKILLRYRRCYDIKEAIFTSLDEWNRRDSHLK